MRDRLVVHVADHTGNIRRTMRLAANAEVSRLVPALVTALGLPTNTPGGLPVSYHLAHGDRLILPDETLEGAGISANAELTLVPVMTAGGPGWRPDAGLPVNYIVPLNYIDHLFSSKAAQGWASFLRHLEYGTGFGLHLVLVPDLRASAVCVLELNEHLREQGRHLNVMRIDTPERIFLLPDLMTMLQHRSRSVLLVEVAAWTKDMEDAWGDAVSRLNERRDALRTWLSRTPLVIVGPAGVKESLRARAPDLWSVRGAVVEIEEEVGPLVVQQGPAPPGPDPSLALRRAASLLGPARGELLLRAAEGFLAHHDPEQARAAATEAQALLSGAQRLLARVLLAAALLAAGAREEAASLAEAVAEEIAEHIGAPLRAQGQHDEAELLARALRILGRILQRALTPERAAAAGQAGALREPGQILPSPF